MNLEEAIGYAKTHLKVGDSIEIKVSLLNSDGITIYMPDPPSQCLAEDVIKCVEVSQGIRRPNMESWYAKL